MKAAAEVDRPHPADHGDGGPDRERGVLAEPVPSRSLHRRAVVVALVVALWLAVQVGLPLIRLVERGGGERPRTFGWQMFSHQLTEPAEQFSITTADGTQPIDVTGLLTSPMRREILYAPQIVAELCARPEVLSVQVRDAEWGTSEVPCR